MTKKRYQGTVFKPQNATPLKIKFELNHALRLTTLSLAKSKTKKAILEENSQEK